MALCIVFTCWHMPAHAQTSAVDSLQRVLARQTTDTGRLLVQAAMVKAWWYSNPDTAIKTGLRLIAMARSMGFAKGEALCCNNTGVAYDVSGNYPKALEYHFAALRIRDSIGDVAGRSDSENNIGEIYKFTGDYAKAEKYYLQSIASANACHDPRGPGITYIALSELHLLRKDFTNCLYYSHQAEKALATSSESSAFWTMQLWNNIGAASCALKDYTTALQQHRKALAEATRLNEKYEAATALLGIAQVEMETGSSSTAIEKINTALQQFINLNAKLEIKTAYLLLSAAYEKQGNYSKALECYKLGAAAQDSLFNDEKSKLINTIQYSYEIDKKQREIELLAKDNALNKEKRRQQFVWSLLLGGMLLCVVAIAFLLYRNGKIKERNNHALLAQKEQIAAQAAELDRLNKTKDKLFAIIGHDLRGPVGSLGMMLDMMARDEISEADFKAVSHTVKQHIDNVYTTLENLLVWSRAQMKGIQTVPETVAVAAVAAQQLALLQQLAERKKIMLANAVASDTRILADREQLAFILRNLVSNAIKFTPAGGQIVISAATRHNTVVIAVEDNGSGISDDLLQHIFTLGSVSANRSSANESGTGLGLIMCKEFAESNGGTIRAESKVGVGSVFYITLPLA